MSHYDEQREEEYQREREQQKDDVISIWLAMPFAAAMVMLVFLVFAV